MSFGTLEGELAQIDLSHQSMSVVVEATRWGRRRPRQVAFTLEPGVWVTTRCGGTLTFAHLTSGQKVLVYYMTKPIGKRVAQKIVMIEPRAQPTAPIPGAQAAT